MLSGTGFLAFCYWVCVFVYLFFSGFGVFSGASRLQVGQFGSLEPSILRSHQGVASSGANNKAIKHTLRKVFKQD